MSADHKPEDEIELNRIQEHYSQINGLGSINCLHKNRKMWTLVNRDEDLDSLIFGLPLLFSPDPDPTCNNGYIKLFSSCKRYKP